MARYNLVCLHGKHYMLSHTCADIMRCLNWHKELYYDDLVGLTHLPMNTLYVYCQRLEKANLLRRKKIRGGTPKRIRTVLTLRAAVKFLDMKSIQQ